MECCDAPADGVTKTVLRLVSPLRENRTKTYFIQECPTCVRRLRTPLSLLGQAVACQHCGAEFLARGEETGRREKNGPTNMERAEQLLSRLDVTST